MPLLQKIAPERHPDAPFRLPQWIDPAWYVLTDSIAEIRSWKAKIHLANDGGKKGAFDEVGYVMISKNDNTIIPIARGDEHRTGYELLWHFKKKKPCTPSDYYPIWPHGDNFLYSREQIPDLLHAAQKFAAYGGSLDLKIRGGNDLRTRSTTFASFLETNGAIDPSPGCLAPLGQKVHDAFVDLDSAIKACLADPDSKSNAGRANYLAAKVLKELENLRLFRLSDQIDPLAAEFKTIPKHDATALEKLFFSFHGVKNTLHRFLRDAKKRSDDNNPDLWIDSDIIAIWGDIDLAVSMLSNL